MGDHRSGYRAAAAAGHRGSHGPGMTHARPARRWPGYLVLAVLLVALLASVGLPVPVWAHAAIILAGMAAGALVLLVVTRN